LTDKFNEHSEASEDSLSFKDQILRDLQEATRLRSLREEEHNKSATMPETPLSTSAESATTRSDSASNKVSNQDFSSHSVSHSAFAKSMTSETAQDSQQDSLGLFSDSQEESLVSDAHSNLASIPKEPIEEETKVNIPQETETSKRRFKRPVWEERQKEAFLQEHHATSDQASQEKVQSELVADGNEDDESISLEPSGKPKKKKGKKVKKKKSSPKDGKQADIVDEEPILRSNRNHKRNKNNRRAGKIARNIIIFLLLILSVATFFGYRYVSDAVGAKDVNLTMDEIIEALQKKGSDKPQEPSLGTVLVKEGYTIDQIAKAVEVNSSAKKGKKSSTGLKAKDFLKLMKDDAFITKMKAKYPTLLANLPNSTDAKYVLEGYLFPATYNIHDDTTVESLAEEMLSTMDTYLSPYYATISSSGHNVNEILTLASLVEKEGATDDDRKNIASVFYNRLNSDMALQSNIAVLYALGKLGQETTLKEDATIDTNIDSPYNDYVHKGLIPGPVDSPSLSAIEAVINPSSTKYMYFVADVTTGNVYFAESYEEHQHNVETYINSKLKDK